MKQQIGDGIWKIQIPFEDIYTSAFLLIEGNDAIILDSGSNNEDAERYIIPAVTELGVRPKYLVSSHAHQDHHGGNAALKRSYPDAVPILFAQEETDGFCPEDRTGAFHQEGRNGGFCPEDGVVLLDRFQLLNLRGHTEDSLAVLDQKTKLLLSCDCLQLFGVSRYKTFTASPKSYLGSIARVRALQVSGIAAAHEYVPLGSLAEGEQVEEYLRVCEDAVGFLENPENVRAFEQCGSAEEFYELFRNKSQRKATI